MHEWNNFGGDERYQVGQAYDQIHAIKLNRQMKFRRAYSAFGYDANTGKLQPLLDNLDEAIDSLLKHLEIDGTERIKVGSKDFLLWERDKVASFWRDRVQANIDQKLADFYFDLDGYASTVKRITKPTVVKTTFCLSNPQAQALNDVSSYLKGGVHMSPLEGNTYHLFKRAVDCLLDYDGSGSSSHPNLSESDVLSLVSSNEYLDNLNTAFRLTTSRR
ncbi:MAG: hypothetical protein Q8R47_04855 [Nanoarchaeota archaeon]|nr:hypothetical protein [Nanoarchaeota archaeon]